jgi:hypothetical protein
MPKNKLIYLVVIFTRFILFNKTYCFSASKSNPDILYTCNSMIIVNNLQVINCTSFSYLYSLYSCFLVRCTFENVNNWDNLLVILDYEGEFLRSIVISTDYTDTPLNATFLNNNFK